MRIAVIGAGVAGLGCAIALSRSGHEIVLLERDDTPLPPDPSGAFDWNRRGAPQVRHSHAFLARLRNLLRDRYPDVLAALHDAGATEMDFIAMLPEGMDHTPMAGDEDLIALACRRTTFEWVLRRCALDSPLVTLTDGVAVDSLIGDAATPDAPAIVRGVHLSDGTVLETDLVVAAGGRRSNVGELVAPLGVTIDESEEDTGIVYTSRFFELLDGADYPEAVGPIGGDLGYLKYGVFQGDNRTFSITFATATDDDELRRHLLDPEQFLVAAAAVPATTAHVDGRARPLTGVEVMARLVNRRRRFTDATGTPLVAGIVAVGDAHTCTNPLYGRGCSLALVQADLLRGAVDGHSGNGCEADLLEVGRSYESACHAEIHPWYRAAIAQDAANRAEADRQRAMRESTAEEAAGGTDAPTEDPLRALMRDGLFPALRLDPVVLRAFLRMFNLLEAPDSLLTNGDVIGRVMAVYQDRDQRPPEPSLGPDRHELMRVLTAAA